MVLFGFRGALLQMANCGNGNCENGHGRLHELPHQSVLAFTYEFPAYLSRPHLPAADALLWGDGSKEVAFAKIDVRVWRIGETKG